MCVAADCVMCVQKATGVSHHVLALCIRRKRNTKSHPARPCRTPVFMPLKLQIVVVFIISVFFFSFLLSLFRLSVFIMYYDCAPTAAGCEFTCSVGGMEYGRYGSASWGESIWLLFSWVGGREPVSGPRWGSGIWISSCEYQVSQKWS